MVATTNSLETPEQVYADVLAYCQTQNIHPKRAEAFASEKRSSREREMLGHNPYTAINAAHFMAACLAAKKLPTDAERVFAQDAIQEWLPHMPKGERLECLATLRRCTPAQLGPDLVAFIANHFPTASA